MKQRGRSCHLEPPWRRRDDPILSSMSFVKFKAHTFRLLIAFAAFSIAMLITIWNSRRPVSTQSRTPGFVFPLYHYYSPLPNASEGEMWHASSTAIGRGLRTVRPPFFKLRDKFYIEMKLGAHAKKFYFNIDTGSKHSWVYCKLPGHRSKLELLGPNGMFEPGHNAVVKCIGKDSNLCHDLQHLHIEPCDGKHNFECLMWIAYVDTSRYSGAFVIENLKLSTRDNHEVKGRGLFGCITRKEFAGERPPLFHDGLIGLGNCKMTLVDQWIQIKLISQHVVGICIGKAMRHGLFGTRNQMGYVSVGVDFKEKFEKNKFSWAKLRNDDGLDCAIIVTLLFVIFEGKNINLDRSPTILAPVLLDTGSDITYLDEVFYDPLIDALDLFAMEKGYSTVMGDFQFRESDQRECWSGSEDTTISPIHNFSVLTFAIKGMPTDPEDDQIRYLTLQPHNYLEWEENKKRFCVNIVCSSNLDEGESIIGASQLREHLFVIDYDNQRIRWQPNACIL